MRVMVNSIPKSGTNLLLRLLTLLGFEKYDWWVGAPLITGSYPLARRILRGYGRQRVTVGIDTPKKVNRQWLKHRIGRIPGGTAFVAHCPYEAEMDDLLRSESIRTVCILRDPRDVVVSHLHYLKGNPRHHLHKEYLKLPNDHERLIVSIRGGKLGRHSLLSLEERYRRILDWEKYGSAMLIRFEDLVGPKGGGSPDAQRQAVEKLAVHLDLATDETATSFACENLFGSSSTFRKGQIGGWKSELSDQHRDTVKDVAGKLLIELGYEERFEW